MRVSRETNRAALRFGMMPLEDIASMKEMPFLTASAVFAVRAALTDVRSFDLALRFREVRFLVWRWRLNAERCRPDPSFFVAGIV